MPSRNKKIALRGMLVAVAFVLSWLEAQIPVLFAVPGMKLGLTNLVVLIALYRLGWKDALGINLLRIVLVGLTFGNTFSMLYSIAGGLLSGAGMILLKQFTKTRVVTVSLSGGILHNVGQILVAMVVLRTDALLYYLVVLWFVGAASGILLGLLCAAVLARLPKIWERND